MATSLRFRDHPTLYVDVGDAQLAYQVVGQSVDAPPLVQAIGQFGNVESRWDHPNSSASTERLATFSRVISFDARGTGLSDPLPPDSGAIWESWSEDMRAVLDITGCDRAGILAHGIFGPSAILFAATYPERVSALFLVNTSSRLLLDDDYPIGVTPELLDISVEFTRKHFGTVDAIRPFVAPSIANDPERLELDAAQQRAAATPKTAARQMREICFGDIRQALPAIQARTVIFHGREHLVPFLPFEMGEFLAREISDARLVPLEGVEHFLSPGKDDAAYEVIEKVLTGGLKPRQSERVFATVVVEDIVGSTQRATELGDERWKQLLNRHDDLAAESIAPSGRVVKSTGDGVVAVFDSPTKALRCMQLMRDEMQTLGLQIRVGVHAGEIERRGEDIAGVGVHIAARVSALAGPQELLVSRTVVDLVVGSGAQFSDNGEHTLKGVPGSWRLFSVVG